MIDSFAGSKHTSCVPIVSLMIIRLYLEMDKNLC